MFHAEDGVKAYTDSWMELVRAVQWNFPGLETKAALQEHKAAVLKFIAEKS